MEAGDEDEEMKAEDQMQGDVDMTQASSGVTGVTGTDPMSDAEDSSSTASDTDQGVTGEDTLGDEDLVPGAASGWDAMEYLRGMVWCLSMYLGGCCPDYTWHYDFKAPPLDALAQALSSIAAGATGSNNNNNNSSSSSSGMLRLADVVVACAQQRQREAGPLRVALEGQGSGGEGGPLLPHVCR
jgi:hypothetical protein